MAKQPTLKSLGIKRVMVNWHSVNVWGYQYKGVIYNGKYNVMKKAFKSKGYKYYIDFKKVDKAWVVMGFKKREDAEEEKKRLNRTHVSVELKRL